VLVEGAPVLSGDAVASADPVVAPGGGGEVRLVLTPDGSRVLADVTSRNVGKRLGLVVDGRLRASPLLMAPLRDGVLMIGRCCPPGAARSAGRGAPPPRGGGGGRRARAPPPRT